ncbi:MAG: 3-phosphoserine/phosphohydroxythreonine transaminase [bacterium]
MSERKHNFNAGPAALPLSVLQTVQHNLLDHEGLGLSILEMSHRTPPFEAIAAQAAATIGQLLGMPDTHEVLFLQGGASLQFAMVPMNLGEGGAYVDTGTWSSKAYAEARTLGRAHQIWTDEKNGYRRVPGPDEALDVPGDAPYLHYTTNNTIYGTQYHHLPRTDARLVADLSSDFLSRPVDVARHALLYAGAQKNAGPAGVTVVIGHKDVTRGFAGRSDVPKILRYKTQAENDSMYNTPNTFGIYVTGLVAEWVRKEGGLTAMAELAEQKAKLLYDLIDDHPLYRGHAESHSRSRMNVTFRMQDETQEKALLKAAEARGIIGLKGHRSVGGLRASIYNAVPLQSVEALAALMKDFKP